MSGLASAVDDGAGVVVTVVVGALVAGAGGLRRERKREAKATMKLRRARPMGMGVWRESANNVIGKKHCWWRAL